jgi:MFS family permease
LLLGIGLGGTPVGAPIVGYIADRFGARWGVCVGAASGFAAALVGVYYLMRHRNLRVRFDAGRFQFDIDPQLSTKDPV